MTALFIILVLPVVIAAHLLTDDWELSILIGCLFYPTLLIVGSILVGVAEQIDNRIKRRRFEKRKAEREKQHGTWKER